MIVRALVLSEEVWGEAVPVSVIVAVVNESKVISTSRPEGTLATVYSSSNVNVPVSFVKVSLARLRVISSPLVMVPSLADASVNALPVHVSSARSLRVTDMSSFSRFISKLALFKVKAVS